MGALRRRGRARRRVGTTRACSGACSCSRARSRSPTSAKHDRGPVFDPVVRFVNAFRKQPARIAEHIFLSCGVYESLIYENRSLVPLLQKTGIECATSNPRRPQLGELARPAARRALVAVPGPLWMVYE